MTFPNTPAPDSLCQYGCGNPDPLNLHILGCGPDARPSRLETDGYQPSALVNTALASVHAGSSPRRVLVLAVDAEARRQDLGPEEGMASAWVYDALRGPDDPSIPDFLTGVGYVPSTLVKAMVASLQARGSALRLLALIVAEEATVQGLNGEPAHAAAWAIDRIYGKR